MRVLARREAVSEREARLVVTPRPRRRGAPRGRAGHRCVEPRPATTASRSPGPSAAQPRPRPPAAPPHPACSCSPSCPRRRGARRLGPALGAAVPVGADHRSSWSWRGSRCAASTALGRRPSRVPRSDAGARRLRARGGRAGRDLGAPEPGRGRPVETAGPQRAGPRGRQRPRRHLVVPGRPARRPGAAPPTPGRCGTRCRSPCRRTSASRARRARSAPSTCRTPGVSSSGRDAAYSALVADAATSARRRRGRGEQSAPDGGPPTG